MARRLIEKVRRRADFDPEHGTPIRLADGQDWHFARPWLEVRPTFRDGAVVDHSRMLTCGPELDALIQAINLDADPIEQAMAVLTLGAFLLLRNYDLEDAELGKLFILKPGDPDSEQVIREIMAVATGKLVSARGAEALADPKARGGGSGSA